MRHKPQPNYFCNEFKKPVILTNRQQFIILIAAVVLILLAAAYTRITTSQNPKPQPEPPSYLPQTSQGWQANEAAFNALLQKCECDAN